jgi:ring-1,2-phenylacetyl-CoA epoxidase subunit PaaD
MKAALANIEEHLVPILETVSDPEIPVLTVLDLGVIREAVEDNGFRLPGYGCNWRRFRGCIC